MRIGDTGRLLDLFECSPFHSERDIIEKCVVKKNRLLVDIPHQAAQIVQGRITHIRSVDRYAPLVHIIETRQQIHQRKAPAGSTARPPPLPGQCLSAPIHAGT